MRAALVALGMTGCLTSIQPRGGTLVDTAPDVSGMAQTGAFSLRDELKQHHVVLVFPYARASAATGPGASTSSVSWPE